MIRNAEVNVNLGCGQHGAQQYATRRVPIPTPALTSSDLDLNFNVMASPAEPKAAALSQTLQAYYARLLEKLSPQGWWPAGTRLEVVLGAVLPQNTSWLNAAQTVNRLRQARRLSVSGLGRTSQSELKSLIRPVGFFCQKARAIRDFLEEIREASASA